MANQYTGKELTFTCVVKRLMFKNEENQYKIYAMTPDPNNSKDVVVDPRYGTVTIMGDKIFDLEPYIQYTVKGKEVTTKYGTGYEVVSIQTKPLETYSEKFGYLSSVLTSLQARTLLSEYPDIINQVRNDRNFEPDYSKLPGITAKRFQKIREKIDANYEYADICGTFYDTMSLAIIKRLKKQYDTVDKIKEIFNTDPYKALCAVDGIGFKKADKICLDIEDASNEARKNNQVPSYEFPFPVRDSVQRCRACALYCLEEIENSDGSTRINLEDLKGKMAILIDEAIQYFSEVIQDKELFFVHPEFETVSLVSTYNKERYIVHRLEEALKIENKWEYNGEFVSTVNGSPLTDEQMQTQKELLDNNIVLLTGSAGCVDADTEFFDGTQWKKISEYQPGDKVLQYNSDGTTTMAFPERYIKAKCDKMYQFQTKYGVSQCLSPEHNVIYVTQKQPNTLKEISAQELYEKHNDLTCGFGGKFLTTFKTFGAGITLSDPEIKLMCAVICDGNFYTKGIRTDINMCRFHLKKERKKEKLRQVIKECGLSHREKDSAEEGYTDFYVVAPVRTKVFTSEWYNCSQSQLKIICDNIMFWDGNENFSVGGKLRRRYSTTIKENADFIQYCYAASGYRATIYVNDRRGRERRINGKTYITKSIDYEVAVSNHRYAGIHGGSNIDGTMHKPQINIVSPEDGYKYCFTVQSHMLVLRRDYNIFITGNCGKSFSMKAMIELLDKANKSYLLLSPTAKAAKVLEAATNRSASTIHRGLGVNYDLTFLHNESNPILSDVVIVDEFSMVDTDLFYNLLKAIDFQKTKLLLVFDPAQLSSVGPGNLAYDLVQSDLFAGVSLNQIFRYSEGGLITVATDTRNCKPFLPKSARFQITKMGKSFVFIPSDNEWCVDGVVGLYQERLKRGDTMSDLIVISARNTGPQGTIEINKQIQRAINPQPADQIITIPKDGTEIEYRLNDVVMQTANDYHSIVCDPDGSYTVNDDGDPDNEILIANGESGVITKVEKDFVVIKYDDYFIRRDKEDLQRTQLGYAISCHRSQGSGYKNVIIVAPSAHTWQLNSNLLYVGFTRAQEHCWCIGSIDTVNKAVTKKMESTRKTNVSWMLAKLYDELEEDEDGQE